MKHITLIVFSAGMMFLTSACDSGNRTAENTDQNIREEQLIGATEHNMAANELPATDDYLTNNEADANDANMADNEMTATDQNMTAAAFAKEAASAGMMEVALGELATQKAQSQQVKVFGKMMMNDHSKANKQLKSIVANKQNIKLSDQMMDKHQQHVTHLSKLTGNEFDKQYMSMMVKDHQDDINKFQKASQNLDDNDIKSFAANTLPVLQMHLDKAQQINGSLEGAAKADNQ